MQYGHSVVIATATAINSFVRAGMAPSAITALSKARNPCHAAGTRSPYFFSFLMLLMSYISLAPLEKVPHCQNDRTSFSPEGAIVNSHGREPVEASHIHGQSPEG